jgi:hypothetical protein
MKRLVELKHIVFLMDHFVAGVTSAQEVKVKRRPNSSTLNAHQPCVPVFGPVATAKEALFSTFGVALLTPNVNEAPQVHKQLAAVGAREALRVEIRRCKRIKTTHSHHELADEPATETT